MSLELPGGGWRGFLDVLNGPPGRDPVERLVHHLPRILAVAGVAVLIPVLFPRSPLPGFTHLEEGSVAPEDVIAETSFMVNKPADQLASEREEAARSVAPIFRLKPAAVDTALARVDRFFSVLAAPGAGGLAAADSASGPRSGGRRAGDAGNAAGGALDTASVRRVLADRGMMPTPEQVAYLADPENRRRLREALKSSFRTLLSRGVAPSTDVREARPGRVLVRGREEDRLVPRDSLLTVPGFYDLAGDRLPEGTHAAAAHLYQLLLVRFTEPSLYLDRSATLSARRQARLAVDSTDAYVLEGERIITAHERISGAQMQKLRAYEEVLSRSGMRVGGTGWRDRVGASVYGLLVLGLLGIVLFLYRPEVYRDLTGFSIVLGLAALTVVAASLVDGFDHPPLLVPVAFAAILVAFLYDGLLAVVVSAVVAAVLAGQPSFASAGASLYVGVAGVTAALAARGVRRRADSWILIALITGGYLLVGGTLVLTRTVPAESLLPTFAWGGANAAVSTVFAIGAALPALEGLTGITTDQTLLELSDLNRPLLRRLSREAPGTYAHSVNTANLAEAACAAIDARALLARVGVYYHDIGKLERPGFFIENQPRGRNPHDRIPPEKSVEVIKGHVSVGLRMAREARLPEAVRDVIREHHGTLPIAYFLEKARELGEEPLLDDYRYDGPKPRSRETAVVMLADGIESTARTLRDPTPERIHELIDEMVAHRRETGQLDECPLTLAELKQVKEAFGRVLVGMYHHRIDYPGGGEEPAPASGAGTEEGAGEQAGDGVEGRPGVDAGEETGPPRPGGRPREGRPERPGSRPPPTGGRA